MKRGNHFLLKHGQITLFAILAIIVLLLAGMGAFISTYIQSAKMEQVTEEVMQRRALPPMKVYIERCLTQVSEPAVFDIAKRGGTFAPADFTWVNHTKVNQFCVASTAGQSCENTILSRQQIEFELEDRIREELDSCIDLDAFRIQGRLVTDGDRGVDVKIGAKDTRIILLYQINATLGDQTERFDAFETSLNVPLGMMITLAADITNAHITSGDFDYVQWMLDHYDSIQIERHKPYPDIVYTLRDGMGFEFRFALGGAPTVDQRAKAPEPAHGCCINTYDNLCYQNADAATCEALGGRALSACTCDARSLHTEQANLSDCEQSYDPITSRMDGPPKHNGESWCSYDSITGEGYDYIGSRHYRHTCINGRTITEECRDYREELCTEELQRDGSTTAACRQNRYPDCTSCMTRECCEDAMRRDCHWNEWLPTDLKCTPQVPPGLRFWDRQGMDTCLAANQKMTCEGASCPNAWIDGASILCAKMGDCGNYRTIADSITAGGFFESDMSDDVRAYVYLPDGLNAHVRPLRLPIHVQDTMPLLGRQTERPAGNLPEMISSIYGFADDLLRITFSDFVRPFAGEPVIEVTDFTSCDVANPPLRSQSCDACAANPQKPCTEYRCKSLGERCVFDPDEGDPTCTLEETTDTDPPIVRLNHSTLFAPYRYEEAWLAGLRGVRISPEVRPGAPLTISVETSEPARCRIDYAPRLRFGEGEHSAYALPSLWFGDPGFSTAHTLRIRMPHGLAPRKIMDSLNFTTTQEFADAIDDLAAIYREYKRTYRDTINLYKLFSGDALLRQTDLAMTSLDHTLRTFIPEARQTAKELMKVYLDGGLALFITCTDRAGNENGDPLVVLAKSDMHADDRTPPRILGSKPKNATAALNGSDATVYLDEPAECRYDDNDITFDAMEHGMGCVISPYQISSFDGGSFACTMPLAFTADEMDVFVRCKDRPRMLSQHEIAIHAGDELRVIGAEKIALGDDPGIFVSASAGIIDVPAALVDDLSFEADVAHASSVDLNLYVDDPLECRFAPSADGLSFDEMVNAMSCTRSDAIARGPYVCRATLNLSAARPRIMRSTIHATPSTDGDDSIEVAVDEMPPDQDVSIREGGQVQLLVRAPVNSSCRLAQDDVAFDSMAPLSCIQDMEATVCDMRLGADEMDLFVACQEQGRADPMVAYTISCADRNDSTRNVDTQSARLHFLRAEPVRITSLSPAGQVLVQDASLFVRVEAGDEHVVCGFTNDLREGYTAMQRTEGGFAADLDAEAGAHEYLVLCRDTLGSSDTRAARFYAVSG